MAERVGKEKKNMSSEGEIYHFQVGAVKISFLDQNIDPW
jgi:hypothetical protein